MESQPTFSRSELRELKLWKVLQRVLSEHPQVGFWDEDGQKAVVTDPDNYHYELRLNPRTLRVEILNTEEGSTNWETIDFFWMRRNLSRLTYYASLDVLPDGQWEEVFNTID